MTRWLLLQNETNKTTPSKVARSTDQTHSWCAPVSELLPRCTLELHPDNLEEATSDQLPYVRTEVVNLRSLDPIWGRTAGLVLMQLQQLLESKHQNHLSVHMHPEIQLDSLDIST